MNPWIAIAFALGVVVGALILPVWFVVSEWRYDATHHTEERGMVAPESIAGFDTYIVFLSNDGVYYTDGYQIQQISANVPTDTILAALRERGMG